MSRRSIHFRDSMFLKGSVTETTASILSHNSQTARSDGHTGRWDVLPGGDMKRAPGLKTNAVGTLPMKPEKAAHLAVTLHRSRS